MKIGVGLHVTRPLKNKFIGPRYNLLTYTEQFQNAAWGPSAAGVTQNAGNSPIGTATADQVAADGTNAGHFIRPSGGVTTIGVVQTFSIYVKAVTASYVHILFEGGNGYVQYRLSDGAIVYQSAGTISNWAAMSAVAAGDSWFRIGCTGSHTASVRHRVYMMQNANNTVAPSEATSVAVLLWGAQLVNGASPGNYQRVAEATDFDTSVAQ